jgi:hypothetical protein
MNLSITLESESQFTELLGMLEKSDQYFKLSTPKGNEIKIEVDHKYYQFLVDKVESLGLSKKQLIEEG